MGIGCAVLAGGKNSRMSGLEKAFIQVEGIPIIHRVLDIVKPLFDEVSVISNKPWLYSAISGINIYPDKIAEKGPLGGIYTALLHSSSDGIFIIACDMPYPSPSIIKQIIQHFDLYPASIVVPRHQGFLEPLFAVYPKSLNHLLHSFLSFSASLAIYQFIQDSPHIFLDLPDSEEIEKSFQNINRLKDLPDGILRSSGN